MSDTANLTLLGQDRTKYPQRPEDAVLETFVNKWPEHNYVVELECPEFTSLCPKTGQPDFAHLTIAYVPKARLVESKALKLYLFSFRNHGEFHEDVCNRIAYDLETAMCGTKQLVVRGDFFPRGGISINPVVIMHPEEPDLLAMVLRQMEITRGGQKC